MFYRVVAHGECAGTRSIADSIGARGSPTIDIPAVLADSAKLLVLEHAIRIALQPKTRDGLTGPFWSDYKRSVRIPAHLEDGDSWLVITSATRFTAPLPRLCGPATTRCRATKSSA